MLTQKYIESSHRSNISSSKSGLFTLVFNVIIFVNALALNVNKRVSANMNVTALSPHQSSTSSFHCWCSIFRRRASGLTGQLDLHRDSFTSALTIGQCVEAQRILFLEPLFEGKHGSSFTVKAAAAVSQCSLWFLPGHEVCLGPSIMIATSSTERYSSLLAPGSNSKRGCVLNGCVNACQIKLQTQAALGQKKTDGESVRQNNVTIKSIHLCAITSFEEKYI